MSSASSSGHPLAFLFGDKGGSSNPFAPPEPKPAAPGSVEQNTAAAAGEAMEQNMGSPTPPPESGASSPAAAAAVAAAAARAEKSGGLPGLPSFLGNLKDNPLFSAGAGMTGLAVGLAGARGGLVRVAGLLRKHFTVSLEIASKDHSYQWVLQHISRHSMRTRSVASQHLGVETTFTKNKTTGDTVTNFDFVPSPGQHWINFHGRFIQVVRERNETMVDLQNGLPWETVTLTTVGRSRDIFSRLLNEARESALSKQEGRTVVYTSLGTEWRPFGQPRKRRPLSSVILAPGIGERIRDDIVDFSQSMGWYVDRGIPYRRGILLYGPPGNGKTSLIAALAGELQYNICLLNLNERGLTDDRLNVLLTVVPPRSFIVLEDVDAAFTKRTAEQAEYSLTFSGLLNALDGIASGEERIVFMTTNHLERLDAALIRPGRVDLREEVSYATVSQARQMFLRFYPNASAETAARWVQGLQQPIPEPLVGGLLQPGARAPAELQRRDLVMNSLGVRMPVEEMLNWKISIAEIQGFFMFFKDEPELAVNNLDSLLQELSAVQAQRYSSIPEWERRHLRVSNPLPVEEEEDSEDK